MVAAEKSASSSVPQYTGSAVYGAQSCERKSRATPFVSEHTAGGDGGATGGAGGDGGAGGGAGGAGGDGGVTPPPHAQHMVLAVKSGSSSKPHHSFWG
jgi:hypothetical protein